jgi:hypothetical protein
MKIELTFEQANKVIIKELQKSAKYLLDPNNDVYETAANRSIDIRAHMRVLEYYMIPSEYKKYKSKVGLV